MSSSRPSRDPVGLAVLAVIGVGALVASSSYLAELARMTGWTAWSSWLLPLTVDVLAAYGVRGWLRPASTVEQRRAGRTVAWIMLAVSIVGNGTDHVLRDGAGLSPWTGLVVLVGTVPPVALFVAVHLYTLGTVPVPSRRSSRRPAPVAQEPSPPVLASVPAQDEPESDGPVDDVAKVRALDETHHAEHGRPISRDKVRAALGCGNGRAGELLKAARAA